MDKFDGGLYMAGREEALTADTVSSFDEENGYLKVHFFDSHYRYMILDKDGNEMAKTIEKLVDLHIDNGQVVFVKGQ